MELRMGRSVFVLALAVFAASSMAAAQAPTPSQAPSTAEMDHGAHGKPSAALTISYAGKSKTWSAQEIAQMPHTAIDVFNAHAKAQEHYAGVPVMALLKTLGVPESPRGKDFRLYLVAEGTDGYQVVYSLGEVAPDVHEGTVIVADTKGDEPLGPDAGAFQLITLGEKRPARWVRNLTSIRVLAAQ